MSASPGTATWQVGDVRIKRIVETEDNSMPAAVVLPDAKPENVLPIGWLRPHFIDEKGNLISSIFALLVLSQGKRISAAAARTGRSISCDR